MSNDLREQFLTFFEQKEHLRYPSASLKSDDPGLLFNVAGMQQFKPYFQGATPRFPGYGVWHRVATSQKCMRAGGKDSDIENVGRTRRHHTFFEMLGNFSFGDYFKKEAIAWAWEFLTSPEWLGLDPERLYATVFTDDDEAYDLWANEVGLPRERISRWGEAENFWPANAIKDERSGPCGPCSEIFYDRGPEFGSVDEVGPNTGSGDRFIEIWNLVFTQFNLQDGELMPLPQQNIDTGMGLERITTVVGGARDAYETELFQPTIRRLVELSGVPYRDLESVAHRIVADHVRATSFAIADGILPANDGAGYVIKMLIRRASRQAFLLGLQEPVLYLLTAEVVGAMGQAYPELEEARERIRATVRAEEEQFLRTLESGTLRVKNLLDDLKGDTLSGEVAFDLWQTYGFPLDLTRDMAAERGIAVDGAGFEKARQEAREVSRSGRESQAMFGASGKALDEVVASNGETRFVGYETGTVEAKVLALSAEDELLDTAGEREEVEVVLDQSPFYPEGGGQIGDSGKLEWQGGAALVVGTVRSSHGLLLHRTRVVRGELRVGQRVSALVDPARHETEKHHSATHLLHAALRAVLGTHVAQAGSLVGADRLRFDFSHPQPLTEDETLRIETLVNRWIQADFPVAWRTVPIDEARKLGAMMLFGEKYGKDVRMVTIGRQGEPSPGQAETEGGRRGSPAQGEREEGVTQADHRSSDQRPTATGAVSVELCGGTHVRRTGQIGSLLLTAEESVSAGVRRLEARVGMAAVEYLRELRRTVTGLASELGSTPGDLDSRVARLQADLKAAQRENSQLRDRLAAAQAAGGESQEVREAGGFRYVSTRFDGLDASSLRTAADNLLRQSTAELVVVGSEGLLVVKASPQARERGAHAGNLVRELARRAGGNGGGRPDMAQAGLKDPARLDEALAGLPEVLSAAAAG
jgi:alanyl-tRNA synthetase